MNKQNIILKWLNKEFGNLTKVIQDHSTHYVNKKGIPSFFYWNDEEVEKIYITECGGLWLLLESIFSMNDFEIKHILKIWLKETYNFSEITPITSFARYTITIPLI
jgi:hypothetical protein